MKKTNKQITPSLRFTGRPVPDEDGSPIIHPCGTKSDDGGKEHSSASAQSTNFVSLPQTLGEHDAQFSSSCSMDDRNRFIKARETADPSSTIRPSTSTKTSSPTITSSKTTPTSDLNKSVTCPTCHRTFSSYKGRRLHESKAHKQTFHLEAQKLDEMKVKVRWNQEEDLLLAKADAAYTGPTLSIYHHLCGVLPHRSKESIKARRLKSKRYKDTLQRVKEQLNSRAAVEEVPGSELVSVDICTSTGEPKEPEKTPAITDHRSAIPDQSSPAPGSVERSWKQALQSTLKGKKTSAYSCLSSKNRTDKQFAKWMKRFIVPEKPKTAHRPTPFVSGNRATRRRKLRAAWLGAYERNPARTAKQILEGRHLNEETAYPEGTVDFWKNLYETESVKWEGRRGSELSEITEHLRLLEPFSEEEISRHVKSMRAGAAGVDNIKLKDIRRMDKSELCEWFNLFLLQGQLPRVLKRFRTTLIPKKPKPSAPSEYRPISVGSFVRRLFTGMMAKRMTCVPTHHAQRGFKKMEGCALQSYTLRAVVDQHIKKPESLSYAFMDVKKAFDSVSHDALRKAYIRAGLPAGLVSLLEDMYTGNTTILSADPQQNKIKLRRGVLQGDPLSPVLFNLVMDDVLAGLSPNIGADLGTSKINCLMFADDAVLMAQTPLGLQHNITTYVDRMAVFGLSVNASKCAAVHIKADKQHKRWYVATDIPLYAGHQKIKALHIGESYRYLGLTTCVNKGLSSAKQQLKTMLGNLSTSVLKPQQRLSVLKTNVLPRVLFETGLEHRSDCFLNDLDIRIRKEVRRWLHLPKDVPIPMFHASVKDGGLGILNLRVRVPRLQMDRFKRIADTLDPDEYVKSLVSSPYWQNKTRSTKESIERVGMTDFEGNEREYWSKRLYATVDGSGLQNHNNNSGYGGRWIWDNTFRRLSGREFVGAMHIRCNSLKTRERATRGRTSDKGRNCPCCPDKRESLAHILQVCWRTQNHRIFRHNNILRMIANKLRKLKFDVILEPRIPHKLSFLKPDIVAIKDREVYVLDPSIVAASRDLNLAEEDKTRKYNNPSVAAWTKKKFGTVNTHIAGVIMDWRGAWSPRSHHLLKEMGISDGLLDLMSFRVLKLNRWIYQCICDRTDA